MITFSSRAFYMTTTFMCCFSLVNAQQFSISTPAINTCSGVLYDNGGPNAPYGGDEYFTTTICPNTPEGKISLEWTVFDLNVPFGGDYITIWDGSNILSPFIGYFNTNDLSGVTVTASPLNISGCITLRFKSFTTSIGNFAATISCSNDHCDRPTAINNSVIPDTAYLCLGDTVLLDGSNSVPFPGTTITEWTWSTAVTQPLVSTSPLDNLILETPGVYAIQLYVKSSDGCTSQPTSIKYILVSGPVGFSITTTPSSVCVPAEVSLSGNAIMSSLTQDYSTGQYLGEEGLIPDWQPSNFLTTSSFAFYADPDATVMDPYDIGNICIDMEHSFMSDLVVVLECPNGRSVTLHDQGGPSAFLGEPIDDELLTDAIGVCYHYCFNAMATTGTWAENGVSFQSLPSGTYNSLQPLNRLIGCPINGEWRLKVADLVPSDNGYICAWSIDLPQHNDSNFINSTATLSLMDPALSYWTGPNLTSSPVVAAVTNSGEHNYNFTVIDSYGCSFDTTLTITGIEVPSVNAGSDIELCTGNGLLQGAVELVAPSNCMYSLRLNHEIFTGLFNNAQITVIHMGTSTVYYYNAALSTSIPLSVINGELIQILYAEATIGANANNSFALFNSDGAELYNSNYDPNSGMHYSEITNCAFEWPSGVVTSWSPIVGLAAPDSTTTTIMAPAQGWYTLTASYPSGCSSTDSAYVLNQGDTMLLQWNSPYLLLCTSALANANYTWYHNGDFFSTTTSPCLSMPDMGNWTVTAQVDDDCMFLSDTLLVCPLLTLLQNSSILTASNSTGTFLWTFNGDTLPDTGPSLTMTTYGDYTVMNTLPNGCVSSASINGVGPIGITELDDSTPLRIIPNPSNGTFRLQLDELEGKPCTVELRDVTGRLVLTEQYSRWSDPQTIQAEQLNQGTYFVQVVSGDERFVRKLVLER